MNMDPESWSAFVAPAFVAPGNHCVLALFVHFTFRLRGLAFETGLRLFKIAIVLFLQLLTYLTICQFLICLLSLF